MAEKRTENISFTATDSTRRAIINFAEHDGVTVSEYINRIISSHIEEKQGDFIMLARAFNVDINKI